MLVLSRKVNERILVGENIVLEVLRIKGNTVRIGFEAPEDVRILRGELPEARTIPITTPVEATVEVAGVPSIPEQTNGKRA